MVRYYISGGVLLLGLLISVITKFTPVEVIAILSVALLGYVTEKILVYTIYFSLLKQKGVLTEQDLKKFQPGEEDGE